MLLFKHIQKLGTLGRKTQDKFSSIFFLQWWFIHKSGEDAAMLNLKGHNNFAKSPTALVGKDIYHRTMLQKLLYDADPCAFYRDPEVQPKILTWTVVLLPWSPSHNKQRLTMLSKMKKPCSGFEPCELLCLLTEWDFISNSSLLEGIYEFEFSTNNWNSSRYYSWQTTREKNLCLFSSLWV